MYKKGMSAELGGYLFRVSPDQKKAVVCYAGIITPMGTFHNAASEVSDHFFDEETAAKFDDWRPPSQDEMEDIFLSLKDMGITANDYMWTTSDYLCPEGEAWAINMRNGASYKRSKDNTLPIWPVRDVG